MSKFGQHIKHLKRLGNSKIRFLPLALFGLVSACDFAPPAIDYERSQVESNDALYNLLADYQTAAAVAQMIDVFCPSLVVNQRLQIAHKAWIQDEASGYFARNPDRETEFLRRIGTSASTIEEYFIRNAGFDLPLPGDIDMFGRAGTYFVARGFPVTEAGMCRAGRAEIRQGTLAGRFLSGMADQPTGAP